VSGEVVPSLRFLPTKGVDQSVQTLGKRLAHLSEEFVGDGLSAVGGFDGPRVVGGLFCGSGVRFRFRPSGCRPGLPEGTGCGGEEHEGGSSRVGSRGVGVGAVFCRPDAVIDLNNEIVVAFVERFEGARTTQRLSCVDHQRRSVATLTE
jgi:hypothetical protein